MMSIAFWMGTISPIDGKFDICFEFFSTKSRSHYTKLGPT